jgi:hypothetical protein
MKPAYAWLARPFAPLFLAGTLLLLARADATQVSRPEVKDLEVGSDPAWVDSGIALELGDRAVITATGTLKYGDARNPNGPEGLPRSWRDLVRRMPLASANRGALIARIGEDEVAAPFALGSKYTLEAGRSGKLFLAVNNDGSRPEGKYRVRIEILERAPRTAVGGSGGPPAALPLSSQPISGADAALLEKIPRRVVDAQGTQGDMVNFLILGPEQELRRGFEKAGWVIVNRTKKDAVVGVLMATLNKKAYVELPMSELNMFGRSQDFGYAKGEPYAVIAERHHFRLWKAPFLVNGQTLWVGAGTHDVGFDRDQRDGKITHRIDPDVDKERDYIARSLVAAGSVAQQSYVLPRNAVQDAKTAHGQAYRSDGRVLVMLLRGAELDRASQFAQLFCAILQDERPDAGTWGPCADYIETGPAPPGPMQHLPPLASKYKVLVVPGVMSSCASQAPAFDDGRKHLTEKYGVSAELLAVPNDSSEANGRRVASYVKENFQRDRRQFILIGYSKGAPDVLEAVVNDKDAVAAVAAVVSMAGAVGGSPIADSLPAVAQRYMEKLKVGGCEGDLNSAMRSLRRDVRDDFLKAHPRLPVPAYSFAAVAEEGRVSKALLETWKLLSAFDKKQDAQLLLPDQLIPHSVFLGTGLADHFAVALPFDKMADAQVRSFADRNRYPRTALLEAVVRFVTQDLDARGR